MAHYGIDVSHWQGEINWRDVKAAGKRFVILKATEGTGFVDSRFKRNWAEAKKQGLSVGAYHYYRPGWDSDAQAAHFYDTVGELAGSDLIPWLDVEDLKPSMNGRPVSVASFMGPMLDTLVRMEELFGTRVGVYTGLWFWNQLPYRDMGDRPLWVAYWYSDQKPGKPKLPNGWSDFQIHQYTSRGRVPGISGNVDLNWIPGELSEVQVGSGIRDIRSQLAAIRRAVDEIEGVFYG
jgi:lysozyme